MVEVNFFYPSEFQAVFTNLNATGRYGPTTLGSHYTGQDHDGQVTLSSGIQQWTVPYAGDYRIEAIGAAGGYDPTPNSAQYRGRGAIMIGTFRLNKGEVIQIIVGQEGGINKLRWSSGGGGGTFVVRGANAPLIIAGGGGGLQSVNSRHGGCDASTQTTGNPGYQSWSGGSNGHGAQTAGDGVSDRGCRSLMFLKSFEGQAFQRHVFKEIYLTMGIEPYSDCKNRCLMENSCVSVNIGPPDKNGLRVCQLSDSDHTQHPDDLKPQEGYFYWASKVRNK
ncbi:hypothetical protein pdam_00022780 [Pocillopora damicornis]|uniref:receptor protein-tyrosine kinase n=1 Tax=Pocillopora damicornis TaxID=46731 RepID=A0A3M6TUS0_POCDA|nr:hypothetical protein pdam_00022780 [Pocillopora damicornis]